MQNVTAWSCHACPFCLQMHPYEIHRVDYSCQFSFQVVR